MKKIITFLVAALFICGLTVTSLAQTSIGLEYYRNDLEVLPYPEVDQNGGGINLEQSFGRFLIGVDYVKLSNNDGDTLNHLYAAHQKIWDVKLGYRLVDDDRFKLDASLMYNRYTYDVDRNAFKAEMKSTAVELKGFYEFSDRVAADLFFARSLHSSGTIDSIDGEDEEYYSFGGKLYYNFSDNFAAYLGYKKMKYIIVPDFNEDSFSGLLAGIKYTF